MRAIVAGAVAAGLVAGTLVMFASANAGKREAPTSISDVPVELLVPPYGYYDSTFMNVWVRGCVGSGWSVAYCRCAINEYTSRLQPDEFETAAAVANSGGRLAELPENVRSAVKDVERDCR